MDFETICKERYSVRSFSSEPVSEEQLEKLLGFVRLAPTAKNGQPYELYVYCGDSLAKVEEARANIFGAPLVIAVCLDENKRWQNRFSGEDSTLQDVGIIATTLMYGAKEVGLDGIYVCMFDPDILKRVTGMPENHSPKCLMLIGHAADDAKPSDRHFSRRATSEFTHRV